MKITHLRTNHLINPLGFYVEKPFFSWITEGTEGNYQEAAQIQVAFEDDFINIIYDSGKQKKISSLGHIVDMKLEPCTRYFWRVKVWTDNGEVIESQIAWFETGKKEEVWSGKWIAAPFDADTHPVLYKKFKIPGKIKSARLYATALGLYELELNGKTVGNEHLAPFYNDYDEWLQYQTYDVTEQLQQGNNALGVILGNGWYKGRFGFVEMMDKLYGDQLAFLGELKITLEDNTTIVIGSDDSWFCHPSWIIDSNIYDGEIYDSNKEILNWSNPNCDTNGFVHAKFIEQTYSKLTERLSPPLIITERLNAVELILTPAGEKVIDFGQVMTGWVEFTVDLPKGEKVILQYGELLQEGNFYNENLRTAKQEYTYISDGSPAIVRPHFTFYGFRYVKVMGLEKVDLDDFTACVIHSNLERTGHIKTSNPKVNRLFENALWSQRGNFVDAPTDCPQRDERMGWTGDAQVFAATASFNMYTPAFYHKYLYDMLLEQKNLSGSVPYVVPDVLSVIYRKLNQKDENPHGSSAWGDAATVIPWTVYLFYGDKEMLEKHFPNMTGWVDFIKSQDDEYCGGSRLWEYGFHFADWLALDNPDKKSSFGGTSSYYVASAYYYYSSSLTAKAAKVLGKTEEEEYYQNLAMEVKQAIQKKYFPDGELTEDTQTAMVLALYMGFVPEDSKGRLVQRLKKKLEDNND
jgi:alpha-L-rhamnosidase